MGLQHISYDYKSWWSVPPTFSAAHLLTITFSVIRCTVSEPLLFVGASASITNSMVELVLWRRTLRCTCRNSSRKWSYRPSCLPLPAANNRVLNSLRSSFHLHVSIISQSCNVLSGHGRELHSHQRESHCWWRPSQYFRAGRLNSKKVFWLLDNSETPEMIHIKFEWWTLCSSAETKIGDHQLMTRWWKFQKSSIPRLAIKWPSKLPSEPALSFISHMAVAMSVLGGVSCMELCKESILLLYIGDIRWCIGLRNYNALQLRLESSN